MCRTTGHPSAPTLAHLNAHLPKMGSGLRAHQPHHGGGTPSICGHLPDRADFRGRGPWGVRAHGASSRGPLRAMGSVLTEDDYLLAPPDPNLICSICLKLLTKPARTPCGYVIHKPSRRLIHPHGGASAAAAAPSSRAHALLTSPLFASPTPLPHSRGAGTSFAKRACTSGSRRRRSARSAVLR